MNKKAKVITASVVALTAVGTGVAYIIHKLRKADDFTLPDDYKPLDDDLYDKDDPFGYDVDPFAESNNFDLDRLAEGCKAPNEKTDSSHYEQGISICYKNGAVPTFDVCSQDLGKSITPKADMSSEDFWQDEDETDYEDDDVEDEDDIDDDSEYEDYEEETDEDMYAEESSLETDVDVSDDKTDGKTDNKDNHSDEDFPEFTDMYEM